MDYDEDEEIILGDDGEEIKEYPEDDPMDIWHSRTDNMSDEEYQAYRQKLNAYVRTNDFMKGKI